MTTKEQLTKAKVQLILKDPFFATLVLGMSITEDKTIETTATDGTSIKYNPDFIAARSIDEVKAILCHDVLHVASFHHTRRNGRDIKQWNKATDYAINPILVEAGYKLPDGALIDKQYQNLSAEKIFAMLPAPAPDDKDKGGNDPGNCGGIEDSPAKTQGEREEEEAKIKQTIAQAGAAAKRAGKLGAGMQRLIEEALTPVINWREVLNRFISETAHNDYSFAKPNTRFIHTGFYLPSLHNQEPGNIILIVDTSASINEELLNQFGAELQEVSNSIGHSIKVIYVDTEVNGTEDIEPDENIKLNPIGGGGTDFKPGFEYIAAEGIEPKAVIYFTDGECHSYPKTEPDYPVLWAKYGNYKNFKPPFGETVNVD